jgi:hypothetical protein
MTAMVVAISACGPGLTVRTSGQSPPHSEVEAILMLLDSPFHLGLMEHLRTILVYLVRSRIVVKLHYDGPP